jgi:hypothetical protein
MAIPVVKVELGVNVAQSDTVGFKLGDATRGVLDNTAYTLSGLRFYDITNQLFSASTSRGKNDALGRIDAGQITIELDNSTRTFDPLYAAGPYYGQLIPGRQIRISCNDYPVISGYIDDIDIIYDPSNRSIVSMTAADSLSNLTINNLPEVVPDAELSGARVTRILDLPEVAWPAADRNIDVGDTLLSDTIIEEGTQAVQYLQNIAASEAGEIFIAKDGKFTFIERNATPNVIDIIFTDEGPTAGYTDIPFANLSVVYGSEQLYNRIILTNNIPVFPDEAIAEDVNSQLIYGPRSLTQTDLLMDSAADLQFLADFLLARFKSPQYRFESMDIVLDELSEVQQDAVLDLEIGDIVEVHFTPSNIPPAIEKYVKIIGISHDWNSSQKRINFSLETLDFTLFILDDAILGVLDEDRLSY